MNSKTYSKEQLDNINLVLGDKSQGTDSPVWQTIYKNWHESNFDSIEWQALLSRYFSYKSKEKYKNRDTSTTWGRPSILSTERGQEIARFIEKARNDGYTWRDTRALVYSRFEVKLSTSRLHKIYKDYLDQLSSLDNSN